MGGDEVGGVAAHLVNEGPGGAKMAHLGEGFDHGPVGGGGGEVVGAAGCPGEEAEGEGAGVAAAGEDALDEARAERDADVAEGEGQLGGSGMELAEDSVELLDVGGEVIGAEVVVGGSAAVVGAVGGCGVATMSCGGQRSEDGEVGWEE